MDTRYMCPDANRLLDVVKWKPLIGLLLVACALLPAPANAQYQHFVGQWKSHLHQVGDVVIDITNVRPDGYIEGRYSALKQATHSIFADRIDVERKLGTGIVDRQGVLRIESAGGRKYELRYVNGQLVGTTPTKWGLWDVTFKKVASSSSTSPRRVVVPLSPTSL